MDRKNLAISLLVVAAVVLVVGLIVVHVPSSEALAGNISSYGGDYTITVGRVTRDTEVIYVLDNVTQRLLVYGINRANGAVDILDGTDLNALAAPGAAAPTGGGRKYP